MRMRAVPVALLVSGLACSAIARADDAEDAKRLFEEGRAQMSQGNVGAACEKFSQAKHLAPEACGVVQNLATCRQQQGRYLDATSEFDELAACATKANQPDRLKFADEQRAQLRSRLGFLSVVVASGPKLTSLYVDAASIDPAVFEAGGKPRPFEPGKHRLEVEREGCTAERFDVTLLAGQAQSIVLPATCGAAAKSEVSRTTPAPAAPAPAVETRPAPSRWQIPVGWTAIAIGGAAVVSAFAPCGLIVIGQRNDSDKARNTATVCTVVGIAGAAIVGAGIVTLLTAPKKPRAVSLEPHLSPRDAGLSATFRF